MKHLNGQKCDLSDFNHGMVVVQAGLTVSETAGLLGYSNTAILYEMVRKKTVSEDTLCSQKLGR